MKTFVLPTMVATKKGSEFFFLILISPHSLFLNNMRLFPLAFANLINMTSYGHLQENLLQTPSKVPQAYHTHPAGVAIHWVAEEE